MRRNSSGGKFVVLKGDGVWKGKTLLSVMALVRGGLFRRSCRRLFFATLSNLDLTKGLQSFRKWPSNHCMAPSSSGLGRWPLTPVTRVRTSLGSPFSYCKAFKVFLEGLFYWLKIYSALSRFLSFPFSLTIKNRFDFWAWRSSHEIVPFRQQGASQ
jgi:hypothetical protein